MALLKISLAMAAVATAQRMPPSRFADIVNQDYTLSRLASSGSRAEVAELKVTDNVISLKRATGDNVWSPSATYVQALRHQAGDVRVVSGSANLFGAEGGSVFLAPVTVGGQSFDVVIDSGSSDPWLVTPDFTCASIDDGSVQDQDQCFFGTPYDHTHSNTYSVLPNENFNISYADGEALTGDMGYESFTMGGITVPHQEFGLVDYAAWTGDGYSSGLVGFAYRTLTSAYAGTNPNADRGGTALTYDPLFVNMYMSQGVAPVFSLAINRSDDPEEGGVLALGGIPNIPYSPGFTTTPIIGLGVSSVTHQNVYEFYTIVIDGWAISGSASTLYNMPSGHQNPARKNLVGNGTQVVVDSGTSLIYADNATVAAPLARLFSPPATWDKDYKIWRVGCDATPPVQFGVAINGKIFYVNGADMIIISGQTPDGDYTCISGVQVGGKGLILLGDVWMKSVLCVFDLGAEVMHFAARQYSGLSQTVKRPST